MRVLNLNIHTHKLLTNKLVGDIIDGESHCITRATLGGAERDTPTNPTTHRHRNEVTSKPANQKLLPCRQASEWDNIKLIPGPVDKTA